MIAAGNILSFLTHSNISVMQLIGILEILIGTFGLYIAYTFRRNKVFRFKLGLVYLLPVIAGIGTIMQYDNTHYLTHVILLSFMFLSTILYYREVKSYTTTVGFSKHALVEYLDDVPDLIWIKDIDMTYTYANKAMLNTFGIAKQFMLGNTDDGIKKLMDEALIRFDFSEICKQSDEFVKFTKVPRLALESGFINDKFYSFQVYKAPIYNEHLHHRKHIGYIGIARDLTGDIIDHREIEEMINNRDIAGAIDMFCVHTERYDTSNIDPALIEKINKRKRNEKSE